MCRAWISKKKDVHYRNQIRSFRRGGAPSDKHCRLMLMNIVSCSFCWNSDFILREGLFLHFFSFSFALCLLVLFSFVLFYMLYVHLPLSQLISLIILFLCNTVKQCILLYWTNFTIKSLNKNERPDYKHWTFLILVNVEPRVTSRFSLLAES